MTHTTKHSERAPDPVRILSVYLNDHLAGAGAGVALFRRMSQTHTGTPAGRRLTELTAEVTEDRESLREIMTALDVPLMHHKILLGILAERAGRLKLNGRLVSRSPLSTILELEAARVGVEGKKELWRTLRALSRTNSRIDGEAVGRLLARAERQTDALETMRLSALELTFHSRPGSGSSPTPRGGGISWRRSRAHR
ncbi:hypothetical protein ACWGCI_10920 [Streptomyces sp. NPDC054949]|uniref:hypothetical protein n=1 Tax=unclassified Streptomyces TaxID=2593676 RepID=UPI0022513309|nr:hypothetical protein [Streptomyces sp. NBC_00424]MCX5079132.1 hypothetical protein [Streptomyces sp. NBC_00424]WUD39303.1 hypothetical protein OHA84_01635 [Streptomyces sp. NBC_00513]